MRTAFGDNQTNSIFIMIGASAGILSFFTLLIRQMSKRGAKSASELMARTVTFWWMLGVFAVATFMHKIVVFVVMTLLSFLAFYEYITFKKESGFTLLEKWISYGAFLFLLGAAYVENYSLFLVIVPVLILLLLACVGVLQNNVEGAMERMSYLLLGLVFFGINLGHGIYLLNFGIMTVFYCVFLTEIRDLVSYWLGKGLARLHRQLPQQKFLCLLNKKIAAQVSPNKSWGVGVLAAGVSMLLGAAFSVLLPVYPKGNVGFLYGLVIGGAIGIGGLMGDLVFSLVKRAVGIKDSGTLFPGHTGVIDRVDSLVFTLPMVFHLLYWRYF